MRVSVAIPTYNSAQFIRTTLDSVFGQTSPPDEILVLDDGSTDETVQLLRAFEPRITLITQKNLGVAHARNVLSLRARGELVAFLDHDDLWHPRYIETQRELFAGYPQAVAFFCGHLNFFGHGTFAWNVNSCDWNSLPEIIRPVDFLKVYNEATGRFGSMSFCSVPKQVLSAIGDQPFRVSGVDDSHLCTLLPLIGPVLYLATPLVAYRFTTEAQSSNRLKCMGLWVDVFEILRRRYAESNDPRLQKAFRIAFSLKRRRFGKVLMAAGRPAEARKQFFNALRTPGDISSFGKALSLAFLSLLPGSMQPNWSPVDRLSELGTNLPKAQPIVEPQL